MIYKPSADAEISVFIQIWRKLAKENGLKGIYFVGQKDILSVEKILQMDFDAINVVRLTDFWERKPFLLKIPYEVYRRIFKQPYITSYKKASKYFFDAELDGLDHIIPTIICGWDHSPRSGRHAMILKNFTPPLFQEHVKKVITGCNKSPNIIFLKSWNEWAEGNYMEPDLRWGKQFLDILKDTII